MSAWKEAKEWFDTILGVIGLIIIVPAIIYGLWCGAAWIIARFVDTVRHS